MTKISEHITELADRQLTELQQVSSEDKYEDSDNAGSKRKFPGVNNLCTAAIGRLINNRFCAELKAMGKLTWLMMLSQMFTYLLSTITMAFCGHLGTHHRYLAAAGLAISTLHMSGVAVARGLSFGFGTFFSQTYGSRHKTNVGIYLQKGFLIETLAYLICLNIYLNGETVLKLIGQDPQVAQLSGQYILYMAPAIWFFFMAQIITRYLENQNVVMPCVVVNILCCCINTGLHYLFAVRLDYGLRGSALALGSTYICLPVFFFLYIVCSGVYKETWAGWSWQCVYNWGAVTKLLLSSTFTVVLWWTATESTVFLAGLLGTVEVATQSILLQVVSLPFMIPMGFAAACAARIGQALGAANIDDAKLTVKVALSACTAVSTMLGVTVFLLRDVIPLIFTKDKHVVKHTPPLFGVAGLYIIFEGMQCVMNGILRGCGLQVISVTVTLIAYYAFALPIGVTLMFKTNLGLKAMWWAIACAQILQNLSYVIILLRFDWEAEVVKAQERAEDKDESDDALGNSTDGSDSSPSVSQDIDAINKKNNEVNKEITSLLSPYDSSRRPSVGSVLWRRIVVVLLVLCLLAGGICTRIFLYIPAKSNELRTPPRNDTQPCVTLNGTISACNETDLSCYN